MASEPPWESGNPQNWETWYEAWYELDGANGPVQVGEFYRTEKAAEKAAEAALFEVLGKVVSVGLKVEATCWTVKRRSRRQSQVWPRANEKSYVTNRWYGNFTTILKSLFEQGEDAS